MRKKIVSVAFVVLLGCGPKYYIPPTDEAPGRIVVSAYTQKGCIENLHEEARLQGVKVKLKEIKTDLGWQLLMFPYYKGYRCIGEVVRPKT